MVKAEALINLTVAFEAEVQVHVALEDEDGADAAPIVAFLGENITVRFEFLVAVLNRPTKSFPLCSCQVTDPNAFPLPMLTLLVRDSDTEEVISEEETSSLSVDVALEREANGASFVCRSDQTLELGNETM